MTEIETAKMSERGQIIIPKDVRDYIGAKDSTIFTIMPLDKETIIMKKLDKLKIIQDFRNIRNTIKEKLSPEDIKEEILKNRKDLWDASKSKICCTEKHSFSSAKNSKEFLSIKQARK